MHLPKALLPVHSSMTPFSMHVHSFRQALKKEMKEMMSMAKSEMQLRKSPRSFPSERTMVFRVMSYPLLPDSYPSTLTSRMVFSPISSSATKRVAPARILRLQPEIMGRSPRQMVFTLMKPSQAKRVPMRIPPLQPKISGRSPRTRRTMPLSPTCLLLQSNVHCRNSPTLAAIHHEAPPA